MCAVVITEDAQMRGKGRTEEAIQEKGGVDLGKETEGTETTGGTEEGGGGAEREGAVDPHPLREIDHQMIALTKPKLRPCTSKSCQT